VQDKTRDDDIWLRLLKVVATVNADNRGYKKELTRDTRVVEDLHLQGLPAGDLLDAIVDEFDVDFRSFPFQRYFVDEGISFFSLCFGRKNGNKKLRIINIKMLEMAVRLGRWDTQLIDPD